MALPKIPAPSPRFSNTRAAVVLIVIGTLFGVLLARVSYLQTYGRQRTIRQADRQQYRQERLPARRGCIFDSTGNLMAGSVQTKTLFADPKFMLESYQSEHHNLAEMDDAVAKLARILDRNAFELSQLLGEKYESRFIKLAERLDEPTCKSIAALDIPGLGLVPENLREYPMGSIGAHLIGGVGKESVGLEGLELKFEQLLAGRDGFKRTLKDASRRGIAVAADDYLPPAHGQHLVLTIDANIQMIAEQELAATCTKYRAKRGEVVVMNPSTGEILALANWPTFNPQNLDDSTPDVRRNRCLTDPYEPGSTIKPFIVGPALQWHVTRPGEVWKIPAKTYTWTFGKHTRHVSDVHFYGPLSTWDVLVKSSNIGMTMIGGRMGNQKLYAALSGFGFGRRTGIELPGEDPGLLHPLKKWTNDSTVSVPQGYELMVTPIQLARAFCAYANGGRLVQPQIIKGVLDPDGNIIAHQRPKSLRELPQVVDPVAVSQLKRVLCDTVVRGTATGARSKTWNIYGKTGTAHISEGKGGYSDSKYNSSFICAAPAESPKLAVAFIVHEPDKALAHYGGTVSAPGASRLVERALTYLQVPPSPELNPPAPDIAAVLTGYSPNVYKTPTASASTHE